MIFLPERLENCEGALRAQKERWEAAWGRCSAEARNAGQFRGG